MSKSTRRRAPKARLLISALFLFVHAAPAFGDFDHGRWNLLLSKHVIVSADGLSTAVDYASLGVNREPLQSYLEETSRVSRASFDAWETSDQLAFLINLYNAATVELILDNMASSDPIDSIRDIGSLFTSAWELERVALFGKLVTLDAIEHDMIRGWGRYNEPRIHFAVNCAAIGCPALRAEAYTGTALEGQLEDATRDFLSDRSRNYFDGRRLRLSSIFKWYREDFERGWGGSNALGEFVARYSSELGLSIEHRNELARGDMGIRFLSYDWGLNQVRD
ncbi:DUF547 domain-containing protein [Gammaproteobacteria bacterium]|nr:DUF547 domain-containing protein [bacterium]MDA9783585.1 DUF547 domain-containing protein [Gammaproteobacteria bacterium]MDB2376067.1 DUF547 domain-containing protein [Gammaproteobacteria bacterium]